MPNTIISKLNAGAKKLKITPRTVNNEMGKRDIETAFAMLPKTIFFLYIAKIIINITVIVTNETMGINNEGIIKLPYEIPIYSKASLNIDDDIDSEPSDTRV